MKEPFFKPEDFPNLLGLREQAAEDANEKLNALIELWPVVHSYNGLDNWFVKTNENNTVAFKARIAFFEEIVKEPCKKHIPISKQYDQWGIEIVGTPICDNCGIELEAIWSPK